VRSLNENQRSLLIDPIVGSWNRRGFEALLDKELEYALHKGEDLSLLHVKLSSFDLILNRFGHDRIVDFTKFTASIIRDMLPNGSSVGSLGADAFVAVCFGETTLETHGVKALVDVDINFLSLSGDELQCTAVQAVDRLLSLS
jgi:GGDEF domain-containing protein